MKQTLTTERLKALLDELKSWQYGYCPVDDKEQFDMLATAEWAVIELLANREAQPVKNTVLFEHSGCGYGAQIDMVTVKLNRGDVVVQIPGNIKKVINEKGEQSAVIYTAPPAPANANPVAWEMRYWNSGHNMWHDWERITAEQHAEMSVQHATDNDYEFRVLYDAPAAPAVQDEIDSFADQVIGTKDKIIRLPAPMPVPLEGIRVYLNADAIISYLEKQGYIVEVSRE